MNKRKITILISLMLVVICLLSFSFIACDKPAGEGGDNPLNNSGDNNVSEEVAKQAFADSMTNQKDFVAAQLASKNLEGYTSNIVSGSDLTLLEKVVDLEKEEALKEAKDDNEKNIIKANYQKIKDNLNVVMAKTGINVIVYTKGEDAVIEQGYIYAPLEVYNSYCEFLAALTDSNYSENKAEAIKKIEESNPNIEIMGNYAINRDKSILLVNEIAQYKFFDLLELKDDFLMKKDSGMLLGYQGNEKDIVLPSYINEIRAGAFKNNNSIKSISFNFKEVTVIEKEAFSGIADLELHIASDNYISNYEIENQYGKGVFESEYPIMVYIVNDNNPNIYTFNLPQYLMDNYESRGMFVNNYYSSDNNFDINSGKMMFKRDSFKNTLKSNNIIQDEKILIAKQGLNEEPLKEAVKAMGKAKGWSDDAIINAQNNIVKDLGYCELIVKLDKLGKPSCVLEDMISVNQNNLNQKFVYDIHNILNIENYDPSLKENQEKYDAYKYNMYGYDCENRNILYYNNQVENPIDSAVLRNVVGYKIDIEGDLKYYDSNIGEINEGKCSREEIVFFHNLNRVSLISNIKSDLETIVLNESGMIAKNAFKNCANLKTIVLQSDLQMIKGSLSGDREINVITANNYAMDDPLWIMNGEYKVRTLFGATTGGNTEVKIYKNGVQETITSDGKLNEVLSYNRTLYPDQSVYFNVRNIIETSKDTWMYDSPYYGNVDTQVCLDYLDAYESDVQIANLSMYDTNKDQNVESFVAYSPKGARVACETFFYVNTYMDIDREIQDNNIVLYGNYAIINYNRNANPTNKMDLDFVKGLLADIPAKEV